MDEDGSAGAFVHGRGALYGYPGVGGRGLTCPLQVPWDEEG